MINRSRVNTIPRKKNFDIFKCLYFIFNLCLIFPFPTYRRNSLRSTLFTYVIFCIGILVCLVHLITSLSYIFSYNAPPGSIANLFGVSVAIWHRLVLSWKLDALEKLTEEFTTFVCFSNVQKNPKRGMFFICVIFTAVSNVFLIVLSIFANYKEKSAFASILHTDFDNRVIFNITLFSCFISLVIFIIMPVHIFAIFYSHICSHLSDLLDNFKIFFVENRINDYAILINSLNIIEDKITLVNEKLDIFVFKAVLFNSGNMYYAVTMLLHPNTYENYLHMGIVCTLCQCSIINFIYMMISAIRVNDRSVEVMKLAKKISYDQNSDVIAQIRFQFEIQKESDMKVWGIGTIKRSFILGMFGTIFTYCMLVDGISSKK